MYNNKERSGLGGGYTFDREWDKEARWEVKIHAPRRTVQGWEFPPHAVHEKYRPWEILDGQ